MTDDLPHADPLDAQRLLAEGRALRALARSLVGDADADDVVHDGWVAALRRPAAARDGGAWLTGVVRNLARRWRRGAVRRVAREQRVVRSAIDDAANPVRIAAESETLHAVARAVHELDEPFRTVVVLRFWHDLPTRTIAERLAVPHETVRSRLGRGLLRLRERLDARPGGRAAWTGALMALASGEQAAAVAPTAAAAALAVLTGLLMHTKLLVGAAALAAAVFAAWAWPRQAQPAVPAPASGPAAIAARAGGELPPGPPATPPREAAAASGEPAAAPSDQPVDDVVAPWLVRVRVVDVQGRGIDGATVTVWRGKPVPSNDGPTYSGRTDVVHATATTDALGNVVATVDRAAVVVGAERDGARSLEQYAWSTRADAPTVLTIAPQVELRGRVVRADGSPAVGALVTTIRGSMSTEGTAPVPPAARVDERGEFVVRVPPRCSYHVYATSGNATTFRLQRDTHGAEPPPPMLLTFPSSISVRGTVADENGEPLSDTSVRVWHAEWRDDPTDEEHRYVRTDANGRFACDLMRHRRYGVLAMPEARVPFDVVWVEPTPERPHVEVELRALRFATIAGSVRRADGTPLANANVYASSGPYDASAYPEPARRERYRTGGEVATGADGSFVLRVHPAIRWTVVVRPQPDAPTLEVRRDDIAPGTSGCAFVLDDAALHGCRIVATVTTPAGVEPSGCEFSLQYLDPELPNPWNVPLAVAHDAERLRLPPLEPGRTIALCVTPRSAELTPFRIAPLRTVAGELPVAVALQRWARLDVRVVFANGRPARAVVVSAGPEDEPTRRCFAPLQANGIARLQQCWPGDLRLVFAEVGRTDGELLWQQTITVVSGANPELVVTVPGR